MQKINENWVDENNNSWLCDRYTEEEAVLKSKSFSRSFSAGLANPSLCASPRFVKIPMVGLMIVATFFISFVVEIPASKMAS